MKPAALFGFALLSIASPLFTGCVVQGNGTDKCSVTPSPQYISPGAVTLDHSATPPANSVQFGVLGGGTYPPGCPEPTYAIAYQWSVSDTIDASITSSGLATCKNTALNPIVVTAAPSLSSTNGALTTTLTCK